MVMSGQSDTLNTIIVNEKGKQEGNVSGYGKNLEATARDESLNSGEIQRKVKGIEPRSIVTGDPYVHGSSNMSILDRFWGLCKANDKSMVVESTYVATAKDVEGKVPESGLFQTCESITTSITGPVSTQSKAYQVEVEPKALDINQVIQQDAILRIMKKILPSETTVTQDFLFHMQKCAAEFISVIGSEAGMVTLCEPSPQRVAMDCTGSRIVKGTDIIEALNGLGHPEYATVVSSYLTKFQVQKKPTSLVYKPPPKPATPSSSSPSKQLPQSRTYEELMTAEAVYINKEETVKPPHRKKAKR